jgi:hypothetical protein
MTYYPIFIKSFFLEKSMDRRRSFDWSSSGSISVKLIFKRDKTDFEFTACQRTRNSKEDNNLSLII